MNLLKTGRSAYGVLTAPRSAGPTLYDVCDPLLLHDDRGNPHLRMFYKKALANPPLRLLLSRAGLPLLQDDQRLSALRHAICAARDQEMPDWATIAAPVGALIDTIGDRHAKPRPATSPARRVSGDEIDTIIRACARQLMGAFRKNGFVPCYAAFNLIGDPDMRSTDLRAALNGLNARSYKNSTLMFGLASAFIAHAPAASLINPPWAGIAEPLWEPVQIRHRSAYYDAFYAEALMDFLESGVANPDERDAARSTVTCMMEFCLTASRERVRSPADETPFDVVTALMPDSRSEISRFFASIREDLGFGVYVADLDTTSCALAAAARFGSKDPILDQPMVDFYAAHQVTAGANKSLVTVPLNDNIDYEGGIVTWIDNFAGDRPFGNDLDPTLNIDMLLAVFRNFERWRITESPRRVEFVRAAIRFQRKLAETGAFALPRSHIYYLPELYCAYFGRCDQVFRTLPEATRRLIDPDGSFEVIRRHVLAYVTDELLTIEMNVFDAALALLALASLGAMTETFQRPLACIVTTFGEGRWGAPFRAYEWNKMKTPTRIKVGGPEVTSALVLSALAQARQRMTV